MSELSYAKYLLKHNKIKENEKDYYAGKTGKNPHGIKDKVWEKASKSVSKVLNKHK